MNILNLHLIEYNNIHFFIFQTPTQQNIVQYASQLYNNGVKYIICLTTPLYNPAILTEHGIIYDNIFIKDGDVPELDHLLKWFDLLDDQINNIGIHCNAGIGRAPLMVVIALIYLGMNYLDAIDHVRHVIKNALNTVQLNYIYKIHKTIKKMYKKRHSLNSCYIC